MTDVYSGHSQFVLLADNRRRWFDGRTLFLLMVVTAPIIIFCGIYTIILKGNETLLFPKSDYEVPSLQKHRAITYNSHTKSHKSNDIYLIDSKDINNIEDYKIVCYYNFPGTDPNDLQPDKIDPNLCSHVLVGFVSVANNSVNIDKSQIEVLKSVLNLKTINNNLKVLLSVGGVGNHGGFNTMVLNHAHRKAFIRSVVHLVKDYGIDGIDLDWEFPNENLNALKDEKLHFTQLLEEFRNTIKKQTRHKFLLTVAVAAPAVIVDNAYDVAHMNEYVDFINVMTYDFHFYTKVTPFTGLNSPLYESYEDKGYFATLNINYTVYYWISKGMDREKMMIGLPTYGHTFRLTNLHNRGLYAPARGFGKLGGNGFADYSQICKFLNMNQISPIFDLDSKSPYATKGAEWVSFDNEQSLAFKAEFVRDHKLGGVMVFSLNSDDYMGICKFDPNIQSKPFPLISKIHEIMDKNYSIF